MRGWTTRRVVRFDLWGKEMIVEPISRTPYCPPTTRWTVMSFWYSGWGSRILYRRRRVSDGPWVTPTELTVDLAFPGLSQPSSKYCPTFSPETSGTKPWSEEIAFPVVHPPLLVDKKKGEPSSRFLRSSLILSSLRSICSLSWITVPSNPSRRGYL